jgi:hypothetical protein
MTARDTLWNMRFRELEEYKRAHNGDCNGTNQLGRWVRNQRVAKAKNKLSAEREKTLNSIGFVWKVGYSRVGITQTDWDTRLEQLVEYKQANGDCNVPQPDRKNLTLGRWVGKQREAKKKFILSEERERKLNSIGFVWNRSEKADCWDERFRQLLKYKQANGDCNVSQHQSQNIKLGRWVCKQRDAKRKFLLSEERQQKLNSIGFVWNLISSKVDWDVRFQELLLYFQTHGDFNVPPRYPHKTLLAIWVSEQRNYHDLKHRGEQTSLTPLREAKLDAIGFTWIVGGTEEEPPMECVSSATVRPDEVRPDEVRSGEDVGVTVPDSIPSG